MKEQVKSEITDIAHLPAGLIIGATYPVQALAFLAKTPQLWSSIVAPILVNLVVGIGLYLGLLLPGWDVVNRWSSGIPTWVNQWVVSLPTQFGRWLTWLPAGAAFVDDILRWLLAIALLITIGLLLVQFGAVFGAPWYGNLAEQIERSRMGDLPEARLSLGRAMQDIGRAVNFQFKKLGLMLLGAVIFLVLGLFPLGGAIAGVGWIVLGSVLVCLDFLDAPLERRRLSFFQKLQWLGRTFPASASFGWLCLVLVSVPLLNLLAVPLCVVAGTLFCCDRILPYLQESSDPEL